MVDFEEIIGHRSPIQILKNMIKLDRIGHAYLFSGKKGIGKRLVAIAFSKAINCTQLSEEQDPCNHCLSCQKIEKGLSPDFNMILPIDDTIKIDQIREIKKNIYFKPLENREKIVMIDDADKMTIEASNALLKILEEPPEFAVLILISAFPDALLPTILSRCCHLLFKPLEIEQQREIMMRILPLLPKNQLENILKIFYGSPGKAMNYLSNQDKMAFKDYFIERIAKTKPGEFLEFLFHPEKMIPDITHSFKDFVDLVILWFHDVFFLQVGMGESHLFFQEEMDKIQEYAQYYSKERVMMILEYFTKIPEELKKHIQPSALLENIFILLGDK